MKVGFIGLGRMGKGMAARVLGGGHDLAVYDVLPQATADLAKAGARVASSIADLCKDRAVIITMLAEDSAVQDVAFGQNGMCASLPAGAIHMAMGTYGIGTIRALEKAHADAKQTLLAVPVLGRPDLAAAGQLGIVPAGPDEALKRCEPLFQLIARRVFYAGPKPESASAIKLANNAVLGCAITAMGEAYSLVRKYGVDPQVLRHTSGTERR
jgi:3-hydroxyisobutyrate dehydrogenase-like beta-hydroxyacid dehydrogenase